MASLERQYFWGCTLTKDKPEFKWLGSKDKENVGEVDILNQLALSQACLGPKAKDAPNVVQVTTKGVNDNTITQPIIVLGSGVRQVQCRLEFSVAATFRLIEGNGPVHLSGSHIQVLSDAYDDSDEDEETIGADLLPKKPSPSPTKEKRLNTATSEKERPPAKKAKLEVENGHAESSDDEPDVLIPINKKDEKPKETKGKDDKTKKKPAVDETKAKQKKAPISAAKKAKMDVDESEDEDDEDDSEDDDDDDFDDDEDDEDDDEDDEDDEDDDDDDDDDDEDDEDDEEEDEDDDDDEDDESDEEPSKKVTLSSKAKPQQKAKNTPNAKNQTPSKQTPKKGNMDASINLTKTPDLNTVKQKLLKSPNLPKKMDRFKNFMKTNMKISDEKIVKDMWTFVQANKK